MPRFFFHVHDESALRDDEGIVMTGAGAAKAAALAGAREMICGQVKNGRLNLHHHIEVEDEHGMAVFSLRFRDAVRIEAAAP